MLVIVIVVKALFFGGGIQAQAAVRINFDTLTPGSYNLDFLAPYGIPNITIGGVTGPKGPLISDIANYEGFDAPSAPNIFLQNHDSTYVSNNQGLNQPHWLEFEFSPKLVSFSLSRIGFYPPRSMPRWQATFYDAEGVELGNFGETCGIGTDCYLYGNYPPKVFTFNAPPGTTIAKMRLTSWWYYCTFRNIGVDDFVLTLPDNATPPEAPTGICPIPKGQDKFVYEVAQAPAMGSDPSKAKPAGVGTAAEGGDGFRFDVKLCKFDDAVDIYLGLHIPFIDPDHTYLIRPDGSFATIENGGLVPWMENVQEEVDRSIFDSAIDISSLPDGVYYVYVFVTPHGTISSYYFWSTYFLRTPTWPESIESLDPNQYDEILELFPGPSPEPLPPPPPTLDPELVVESGSARDGFSMAADEFAELRIVDAALLEPKPIDPNKKPRLPCAPHLMKPRVTLENVGTIANDPTEWRVEYSFWKLNDGGHYKTHPDEKVEQVGSIEAGSLYHKPFVIEPGTSSPWDARGDGVYSNLYPRTIRWDLYRVSREFEGQWEHKDTLIRSFDEPGPNLMIVAGRCGRKVTLKETEEKEVVKEYWAKPAVWVKNIGDAGTGTPVHVMMTVPIKDIDQLQNSSPSETFNQAFRWYWEFPPIPANGQVIKDGTLEKYVELPPKPPKPGDPKTYYGKKGPDWETIYVSVWRDCEEGPEGWDKDIRDNNRNMHALVSPAPAK